MDVTKAGAQPKTMALGTRLVGFFASTFATVGLMVLFA